MVQRDLTWKVRGIGMVFMGLTAVFTVLGGVGTVCVAWFAENWRPFAVLVPYKPIYQTATVFTLLAGVAGIIVTYALLKGEKWSYPAAITTLIVGLGTAGTKMYYSNMLRGTTAPTNFRAYVTILTLAVFLIMRIPAIWNRVDFTAQPSRFGSWATPGGISLFVGGLITLTTQYWAAGIHVVDGVNLVNVIQVPLTIAGASMLLSGCGMLVLAYYNVPVSALLGIIRTRLNRSADATTASSISSKEG